MTRRFSRGINFPSVPRKKTRSLIGDRSPYGIERTGFSRFSGKNTFVRERPQEDAGGDLYLPRD